MTTIEEWGDLHVPLSAGDGTWWPFGTNSVPTRHLRSTLALAGRHHARRGMRLYVSYDVYDLLDAASSIGTAVELTTKAYLASVSTSLLALKGDRDSLFLLAGHAAVAIRTPLEFRSVSAAEALDHARRIEKTLPWRESDPTLEVRNAALHMGIVQHSALRSAVIQMCRLLEVLVPAMGLDLQRYWGDEWAAVESVLDEARTELAGVAAAKRAAAVARFKALTDSLGEASIQVLLATRRPRPFRYDSRDEEVDCPVCGGVAWLGCVEHRSELQHERNEDGDLSVWVDRVAYSYSFTCSICQLELEDDELDEFDLPREIELETDYDPEEGRDSWDSF